MTGYRAALHEEFSAAIIEAAHEWLDATVIALVPVWSGASVSTFYHLARAVSFSLTAGTAEVAPHRRSKGRRASDGGLEIDRSKGTYHFHYRQEGGPVTNVGDIHVNVQGGQSVRQTARTIAAGVRRELRRGTSRL